MTVKMNDDGEMASRDVIVYGTNVSVLRAVSVDEGVER